MYDIDGTRLLYCNHKEYYDSFLTLDEVRQRDDWINLYKIRESWYPSYCIYLLISSADKALKDLVISEYIRLNILYRSRTNVIKE
jgi:hypothetical protein